MCIFTEILVVLIVYILESYVMSMLPLISLKGGLSALFTFPILRVVCILLNIHVRFFKKKLAISRSVHGRTSTSMVCILASVRCRCLHDRAGTQPTGSLIAT
jgi:hypothetical protein